MANISPITLTVSPPHPSHSRALACSPLPNEWKICYVAKKAWELIGIALNQVLEWSARIILFSCQASAAVVGMLLTAPIAVIQILFQFIFSRSKIKQYTIGTPHRALTQQDLNKSLQALCNRNKVVDSLCIQHGSQQPVQCDASLIRHLALLKPQKLTFINCQVTDELQRKLTSVLDLELSETRGSQTLWVKHTRIPEETISITTRQEFIEAINRLNAEDKRVSVLNVVGNRSDEVTDIQLNEEESNNLRKLHLYALHLEGCMLTTHQRGLPNEDFSSHLYTSKTLLEDLRDRRVFSQ